MSDFKNYLDKQLRDKDFKKEWEALEPEFCFSRICGSDPEALGTEMELTEFSPQVRG